MLCATEKRIVEGNIILERQENTELSLRNRFSIGTRMLSGGNDVVPDR